MKQNHKEANVEKRWKEEEDNHSNTKMKITISRDGGKGRQGGMGRKKKIEQSQGR